MHIDIKFAEIILGIFVKCWLVLFQSNRIVTAFFSWNCITLFRKMQARKLDIHENSLYGEKCHSFSGFGVFFINTAAKNY